MAEDVVTTVDLKKYFPTRKGVVKAIDGVNLSVSAGRVFGFLGPNGAGKTTTLSILTDPGSYSRFAVGLSRPHRRHSPRSAESRSSAQRLQCRHGAAARW